VLLPADAAERLGHDRQALDPVAAGLVASFNRTSGNATGISLLTGPLGQKSVEFLQELVPKAAGISMLVNPVSPDAVPEIRHIQAVARISNLATRIINASTAAEIETAFVALANSKPHRLLVGSGPFFVLSRDQIAALAAKLGVPINFFVSGVCCFRRSDVTGSALPGPIGRQVSMFHAS
jgi:putative ABC transport system substrate-binding protein